MGRHYVIWALVFQFLEANDLVRASGVCFTWWKMIFGLQYFTELWSKKDPIEGLDLAGTGKLYKFVPLRLLAGLSSFLKNGINGNFE